MYSTDNGQTVQFQTFAIKSFYSIWILLSKQLHLFNEKLGCNETVGYWNVKDDCGDGTINDGYLARDGLHLSWSGFKRLASNLNIQPKDGLDADVMSKRRPKKRINPHEPTEDNRDRQTVQPRPPRRHSKETQGRGQQQQHGSCRNCGEAIHGSGNCRFGQEIECFTCGRLGHKAKFCDRRGRSSGYINEHYDDY
ncbi:hypothetical protein CAPTEDRAFT_196756 [Capitella teleta]|uniref:CCHC-type domain-containing protein n=1 Tax=Capitella teleta TaxID=283909 RepID=R7UFA1_CAPTE|nr:hypothetical protein CAPTEDRAFT_196756 [Capitella teleta]|eukprot:ELU04900.1 hypothetical protein CAPTEDRAFT_196756 [Capitella teleta]